MIKRVLNQAGLPLLSGITVHCPGSPGHGSRFVENTAAEKLVLICTMLLVNKAVENRTKGKCQ